MNIKKRNAKYLHHPFHFTFLSLFPIAIIIIGTVWVLSLQKARDDLKSIGMYLRNMNNPGIGNGLMYHRVRDFDTIGSIAEEYNISVNTIKWANDIPPEGISEDMVLLIPPVTGVVHTVKNRETIESIAKMYGVTPEKITDYPFNEFSDDPAFPITPGQILIIPDGRKDL